MKTIKYLRYLARHKWFVLIAGLKIGVSWWRLLVHDLSKYLPSEFGPYREYFYGGPWHSTTEQQLAMQRCCVYLPTKEDVKREFDTAWLLHQHRNPHHWQYWVLKKDDGGVQALRMPRKYVLEMVADWMGAGRAITGRWEVKEWYEKNKEKMVLSKLTRKIVERVLEDA